MSVVHWDESLTVHIEELDRQHQHLLDLANQLFDTHSGREGVGRIIDQLLDYSRTHFVTEENYLAKRDYPGLVEHQREHAEFLQRIAEFRARFLTEADGLTVHVMVFLSKWLRDHFSGSDQVYCEYFEKKQNHLNLQHV